VAKRKFRSPPPTWGGNSEEAIRKVVLPIVAQLMRGKANNTYNVTLAVAPATTTTLVTEVASADSEAFLTPRTATAATAIGAGVVRAVCADDGTVTITHDSNAAADRTFGVLIAG
jgi:hypothetical protein